MNGYLIQAQARLTRAAIIAAGMQAENDQRRHLGQSVAYREDAFRRLIDDECIDHNSIDTLVRSSREEGAA